MSSYQLRHIARKRLNKLLEEPSKVLVIHYSQIRTHDEEDNSISPLISAIIVRSLDGSIYKHFAIHLEADKADIPIEEIENLYRELEFQTLKSFNEFVKRHNHCLWIHWDMKNIHFGFEAIKHRFEKLFRGLSDRYEEIPSNNKINLTNIIEGMYGDKFAIEEDKLATIIRINEDEILNNNYLTLDIEGREFENKNFNSILRSLDCKADFICKAIKLLQAKKLKVQNKNNYAIFLESISHPIFALISGILAIIIGILGEIYL